MTNEELVLRIQTGEDTEEHLAQLWEQNRGAAWQHARRYVSQAEMADLMQEAYLTLHKAAFEYEPGRGASFLTMYLAILPNDLYRYVGGLAPIRIPEHERLSIGRLDRLEKEYRAEYGRYPTSWEVCRKLKITPEKLERIRRSRSAGYLESLDRTISTDDSEVCIGDSIPSQNDDIGDVEEQIYQEELSADLWAAVDSLEPMQGEVIRCRYKKGMTRREIGDMYGRAADWPANVETAALRTLRRGKYRRILLPYWEDNLYNKAMQGCGFAQFDRTRTSSTEREALKRVERFERRN